jgi:hypothetical protein
LKFGKKNLRLEATFFILCDFKVNQLKTATMKKIATLFCLILALANNSCTDMDDNLTVARPQDVIPKNSEMYNLIERVVNDTDDPIEDIACIDFVYPLQVKLYDANLVMTSSVVLVGDEQFSNFLGSIDANQALSISYPITTALANGDLFSVNNNAELKLAIDNCSREDIISYCNSVFCSVSEGSEIINCVWKVEYTLDKDNKYVGGTFLINPDNSLVFNYNNVDFPGNWIFEFVNNELHLNINLEGTSQVASDWNIDRRIIVAGTIEIINTPKNIVLKQYCEDTHEYAIGDLGPASGIVFYDKGEYSHGWRYMEAAPQDLPDFEWGCSNSLVGSANAGIGDGLYNSGVIANFHDSLANYYGNPGVCNPLNNGTVSAQKTLSFELNGYADWFLPSENELSLMYQNLHVAGLGNFAAANYWSATEADAQNVQTVDFATGNTTQNPKIPVPNAVKTRAVRYF